MNSNTEKLQNEESKYQFDFDFFVSNKLGEFGKYQKRTYILLGLPAICCALHTFAWVFIAADVPFRCQLENEDSANASYHSLPFGLQFNESFPSEIGSDGKEKWPQCQKYDESETIFPTLNNIDGNGTTSHSTRSIVGCDGKYIYDDSQYKSTARIDFQLICENKFWYPMAETFFKSGVLTGAITFGSLSDRLGRRPVFFWALCQQVTFGILASVAPNFMVFAMTRFLVGMANSGVFLVAFVIAMELVGKQKRMYAAMGMQYFFTVGFVIEGILAFLIRDWRQFQLVLSLPGLVFLSYYWFLPESVRWLLARGKKTEAIKILKKASATNKIKISEEELTSLNSGEEKSFQKDKAIRTRDILKYRKLMKRSVIVFLCWFVNSGVYYGLALNSGNLGGNDYVNFLLSGAVEVPAYTLLVLTLNRFGRKKVTCGCMITAGVFLIACGFIPSDLTWLLITFNMMGKLFNAAGYAAIYIYAAELFPTVIRNSFMGISSVMARVGGILSDYVILVQVFWKPLPHLIFGFVSFSIGLLSLLLPETMGKRLPETMEDGEDFR